MNRALHHVLNIEIVLRCAFNGPRRDNQIRCSHHAAHLRDQDTASFGVVEHSNITVSGAFCRDVADEVLRKPVEVGFRHFKSPLHSQSAESNTDLAASVLKSAFHPKIRSAATHSVHIRDLNEVSA